MFLTWYQVNARHPRAESLLKKTRKIAQLTGEILENILELTRAKCGDNTEENKYVNKINGLGNKN